MDEKHVLDEVDQDVSVSEVSKCILLFQSREKPGMSRLISISFISVRLIIPCNFITDSECDCFLYVYDSVLVFATCRNPKISMRLFFLKYSRIAPCPCPIFRTDFKMQHSDSQIQHFMRFRMFNLCIDIFLFLSEIYRLFE